jgi:hypothetical protein
VYQVGRKLYSEKEIKFLKEITNETDFSSAIRDVIHYLSSILMILSMLTLIGYYGYYFVRIWLKNYDYILARISSQDSTVSNRVSTVSVLKYAIWHNETSNNQTYVDL